MTIVIKLFHMAERQVEDSRDMVPIDLGQFGGVVSVGAFEHFCSVGEFQAGKQDGIYQDFFAFCWARLPVGGRLFIQTMVWDRMPDPDRVSLDAPKGSDEYLLALLRKFYPGSWLPNGQEQIIRNAKGFKLIDSISGKDDYIETMKQWGARTRRRTPSLLWERAKLVPRYLTNRHFRLQVKSLNNAANRQMFERGIIGHFRMTFEKVELETDGENS